MACQAEIFERTIDLVLSSWTALDLAVSHFDGSYREGQNRRTSLLEALSDSIRPGQYSEIDIAEFISEYMLEQFSVELDDNSHYEIAKVLIDSWARIVQGCPPAIVKRSSGAAGSVTQNCIEEVSSAEDDDDVCMEVTDDKPSRPDPQSRIITDDDGWSTVLKK